MNPRRSPGSGLYLALFRSLLLLLPPALRHRYGHDMTEALAASLRDTRGRGGRLSVFVEALGDLLRGVLPEWRETIRREKPIRTPGDVKAAALPAARAVRIVFLWREVVYAIRSLRRDPGFAIIAVLTLASGIGVNTALFSVIEGALLRPLPYSDPDRLVWLSDGHETFGPRGINQSIPNLVDLRRESRLLSSSAIYSLYISGNLATAENPERVRLLLTSSEMLSTLGMPPMLGRDLRPGDDEAGAPKVAILTPGLWKRAFGADPGIVGKTITLDAEPVLVVGVAPTEFTFPGDPELIVPLQYRGAEDRRDHRMFNAVGRLAPGADVRQLRAELAGIFSRLAERYPEANEGWSTWAEPLQEMATRRNRQTLFLLAGAAALVLLMACVNVANLLLVRSERRARELGIRLAIGARRGNLLPVFLGEAAILSVLGGALGILGAFLGVDFLTSLFGSSLQRADQISVDATVLGFALMVSLVVGGVVGLLPMLRTAPGRMSDTLLRAGRQSRGRSSRLGRALVVGEVALGVLIVISAGLLTKSLYHLQRVDLGVENAERVLTFQLSLPSAKYEDDSEVRVFFENLLLDLQATNGVEGAALVNRLPLLGGASRGTFSVVGAPDRIARMVSFRGVTSGYFRTVGIPLERGRWLDASEFSDENTRSVLINERLAKRLFGNEDPLGRSVGPGWKEGGLRVVGVVGDVLGGNPTQPAPPAFYYPYFTRISRDASVVVRTTGNARALLPVLRKTVERRDPALPIYRVRTLDEIARARWATQRMANSVFALFAGLALLLGAVGIYGVMSSTVAQRSRELGVRLALGASGTSVLRAVLAQGARLTLPGLLIGLGLALAGSRVLGSLLFEVSPLDPLTFGVVSVLLGLVSLVATCPPALRAIRIDPMECIRDE